MEEHVEYSDGFKFGIGSKVKFSVDYIKKAFGHFDVSSIMDISSIIFIVTFATKYDHGAENDGEYYKIEDVNGFGHFWLSSLYRVHELELMPQYKIDGIKYNI